MVAQVACGTHVTFFLTRSGDLYSCGRTRYGLLGQTFMGAPTFVPVPRQVYTPANVQFRAVALGQWHGLALSTSGNLYSWGRGELGRLALKDMADRSTPQFVHNLAHAGPYKLISCGQDHSIVCNENEQVC